MDTEGVKFDRLSFTLDGGRSLLRGISFACEPGTTTALLGRSGSGKTTLLRTVNALVRPTSGNVSVQGRDVATADTLALRRSIGYVIQESGLFPHMTVERNLGMPLEIAGERIGAAQRDQFGEALDRVGLNGDLLKRYPWQLSGGQRQRVGVARALVTQPQVLLMDEPFGALDPLTRAEMQNMVHDLLAGSAITTLMVTHDLAEALYLADRVVLMHDGEVAANLSAAEVETSDNAAVQAYVKATKPREKAA